MVYPCRYWRMSSESDAIGGLTLVVMYVPVNFAFSNSFWKEWQCGCWIVTKLLTSISLSYASLPSACTGMANDRRCSLVWPVYTLTVRVRSSTPPSSFASSSPTQCFSKESCMTTTTTVVCQGFAAISWVWFGPFVEVIADWPHSYSHLINNYPTSPDM